MLNAVVDFTHYNYSTTISSEMALGAAISIIVLAIFIVIAVVLAQIFLGLAVYNDARAKGNSSPGMWGVLSGLFGWIPAVIYLCTRNSASQRVIQCAYCGFLLPANAPGCPSCNNANPYAQSFYGPEVDGLKKRSKGYLIASICLYAALILMVIAIVIVAVVAVAANGYYY